MKKSFYFWWCLRNFFSKKNCPDCNSNSVVVIQRKYFVSSLNECNKCKLRFRHPIESEKQSLQFYQKNYTESDGITTVTAVKDAVDIINNSDFGVKTLETEFHIIQTVCGKSPENISILDYGSSWGYQSYQFKKAGYSTYSFEISKPRLEFGNSVLNLSITDKLEEIAPVDVFYSSHVIEHMPNPGLLIQVTRQKTKINGLIVLKCPNGSREHQDMAPDIYNKMWGMVHPNFISKDWIVLKLINHDSYFISSSEGERLSNEIIAWNRTTKFIGPLENPNLTVLFFNSARFS